MYFIILLVWDDIKGYVFGGSSVTLIIFLLGRFFDKRKDKVTNDKTEAETRKTEAEAKKIEAEANETTADIALKIAQRMSEDNVMLNQKFEKVDKELDEAKKTIKKLNDELADVQNKLNGELQSALLRDREIEELREELRKLKGNDGL